MRTSLRRGMAVAFLLPLLMQAALANPVSPPSRSRRNLGAEPIWVPIGFRGFGIPGSGGTFDATNNSVNDLFYFQTPSFASITALKLVYTGFDLSDVGPIDRAASVSGSASVFVPGTNFSAYLATAATSGSSALSLSFGAATSGNMASVGMGCGGQSALPPGCYVSSVAPTYNAVTGNLSTYTVNLASAAATSVAPGSGTLSAAIASGTGITFSGITYPAKLLGSRQISIPPMHDAVITDPMPVQLAANSGAFVHGSWTFSAPGVLTASLPAPSSGSTRISAGGFTESSFRGSGMAALDSAPVQPSNSGGGWWPPAVILAQLATDRALPSVMVIGDSIAAGTGDAADSNGRMGFIPKSLGNNIPWFSAARGSTAAVQYQSAWRGLYRLAVAANVTHLLLELGRNDIESGIAATGTYGLKAYLASIAAPFIASGVKVYVFTMPPTTNSTDGWATLTNQTVANSAYESQRLAYNSDIRSNWQAYGYAGLIDWAALVESGGSSSPSGKWRVDLGVPSADGVHPSSILVTMLVGAGLITPGMFSP